MCTTTWEEVRGSRAGACNQGRPASGSSAVCLLLYYVLSIYVHFMNAGRLAVLGAHGHGRSRWRLVKMSQRRYEVQTQDEDDTTSS